MPYMIAVSLEMSDEPKIMLKKHIYILRFNKEEFWD